MMDSDPRLRLREATAKALLQMVQDSSWSNQSIELFSDLVRDENPRRIALEFIQKPAPLTNIVPVLNILCEFYQKQENISEEICIDNWRAILECVKENVPVAPLNLPTCMFMESVLSFAAQFKLKITLESIESFSPNQIALVLAVMSVMDDISEILPIVASNISPKLTISLGSFAILKLMTKHKSIENGPTIKTIISFYKSLSDTDLISYATPIILKVIILHVSSQNVKEIPPIFNFVLRRLRKSNDCIIDVCSLINSIIEIPDGVHIIKPFVDELVQIFAMYGESCKDTYVRLVELLSLKPLEYLPRSVKGSLVLVNALLAKHEGLLSMSEAESLLANFESDKLNPDLLKYAAFCVRTFSSASGVKLLIGALKENSRDAYELLTNGTVPFEATFASMVSCFTVDRANELYIQALQAMLQVDVPTSPVEQPVDDKDSVFSDCDSIPDFGKYLSEMSEAETCFQNAVPTTKTILFCKVIASCIHHSEVAPLLVPSATSICEQFGNDLASNLRKNRGKHSKLELVAAYSNALLVLDTDTLYSVAQTFLTMLPGQAMLFLAVSLQSMPREVILSILQKATAYAYAYPDLFGRSIALVSHSHPRIALEFTNNFVSGSTTKRRVFLVFRSSELNEDALVVVLKIIGYCSSFVDDSFFVNDFLQFASSFLNSNLSEQLKKPEICRAALFAIRKVATRITKWQHYHPDFVFPLKDFLVRFVYGCKEISLIETVNVLAALTTVKPIRCSQKADISIQMFKSSEDFGQICTAVERLYTTVLDTVPSLSVFVKVVVHLFENLLSSEERCEKVLAVIHKLCSKWNVLKVSQEEIDALVNLLVYILPLVFTEKVDTASGIVTCILSLQWKAKNEISENNVEIPNTGRVSDLVNFLSAFQILGIATRILSELRDGGIKVYRSGAAEAVFSLISLCASHAFNFDHEIITIANGLLQEDNSKVVVDFLIKSITEISKYRLHSVLSTLSKLPISRHFGPLISSVIECHEGQFLTVLTDFGMSDDASWFSSVVPLIGQVISKASDDIMAKLIGTVVRQTEDVKSPLFVALFGEKDETSIADYMNQLAQERPLVFEHLVLHMPDKTSAFLSEMSLWAALHSASACPVACHGFLQYVARNLIPEQVHLLTRVLKATDANEWTDLVDSFVDFSVFRVLESADFAECVIEIASRQPECAKLWQKLGIMLDQNVSKIAELIATILRRTDIKEKNLVTLLPTLILNKNEENVRRIIDQKWPNAAPEDILTGNFGEFRTQLLGMFVDRLKTRDNLAECSFYVALLCTSVDDIGVEAIRLLINALPSLEDDSFVAARIERLLE